MPQATVNIVPTDPRVTCHGEWTAAGMSELCQQYPSLAWPTAQQIILDGSDISYLDSAGAWLLHKLMSQLESQGKQVALEGFSQTQQQLLAIVLEQAEAVEQPVARVKHHNIFHQIGVQTIEKIHQINYFLAFIGELSLTLLDVLRMRLRLQWRALAIGVDETGFRALPIIALLSFLIGIVLAYQMGTQLQYYGANIYVVNVTGVAILREFGPLITAIIAAGRTGSAFTAQIGTMMVNEEVDALYTMGLSPIDRLVIPKVLALMITLPLLTVWADCFGVLGSMVMSKSALDIGYYDFLLRFEEVVRLKTYTIGLSKAPVYALIIAAVGCFQGFQVSSSAESVGHKTTKSVVQAIFLIIIVDAIFSIMFSWQGI